MPTRLWTDATVPRRFGTLTIGDQVYFCWTSGLHRDFPLTEQIALRIRIQAFNSLNHPNLRNPQDNVNSSSFGQISAVHDPRIWQFGAEIRF